MPTKKRLLAIVAQGGLFTKIEPVFQHAPLEAHRAADGATGHILARNVAYELILSEYPVPGAEEDLIEVVRAPDSLNRGVPVLLIGDGSAMEYAARHNDRAVHVMGAESRSSELLAKITDLLGISVRLARRLLVQIEVEVANTKTLRACQTRDISITGMFLRTGQQLPMDSELPVTFYLPGESKPLQSKIRVVRHTDPLRELPGMGVEFTWMSEEDRERLREFLNRGLAEQGDGGQGPLEAPGASRGFDRFARLAD